MYNVVHTGAKTQLGGLNEGLFAAAYHPSTPEEVNKPAIVPTSTGISMDINSFIAVLTKQCKRSSALFAYIFPNFL